MDYDSESKLLSLFTQLIASTEEGLKDSYDRIIPEAIYLLSSIDWDLQPKPESEFMSLITQTISFFLTMDLVSQPKPLLQLMSFFHRQSTIMHKSPDLRMESQHVESLIRETFDLEPEPELMSLIYQILSLVLSMFSVKEKFVFLCPQAVVTLLDQQGKFHVVKQSLCLGSYKKWRCFFSTWLEAKFTRDDKEEVTYIHCQNCNGENHKEFYNNVPAEIKCTLHRRHSLQLVMCTSSTRKCYCCDEGLVKYFYYCSACDVAINITCATEKQPVLSVDQPKWHEHTLALFPSRSLLTCDACALTNSSDPFYTCPPCDFLIHQSCISLPRVIRISRHHHRIAFTFSFGVGDWSCGVCRTKIDNNYGGYCCIKEGCSYGAHSKCATQSNVWDGEELEGIPEEIEEVIEPFLRISDGIIQHFLHQHHHLRLDENTSREYDENRQCHACVTPIYFGNFYSCLQCDFILHEECANLPRNIYHHIHQHKLTLLGGYDGALNYSKDRCYCCYSLCRNGFFYKCSKEGCMFQLQVQCAMLSEPLVHESHLHPLYLTSKPGENCRSCSICKVRKKTFNCIECDRFSLCFGCATLPQKVRYKHDNHTLTLSYGTKETTTIMYWCEVCEKKINPTELFYMCDEYCCVTLHIRCLLGCNLYMKPDSLWIYNYKKMVVLANDHMSRPICSNCANRCLDKIVIQCCGSIFCSTLCTLGSFKCSITFTSDTLQRVKLQQLFHLNDSGLEKAFIDVLPVFQYKEIVGGLSL